MEVLWRFTLVFSGSFDGGGEYVKEFLDEGSFHIGVKFCE